MFAENMTSAQLRALIKESVHDALNEQKNFLKEFKVEKNEYSTVEEVIKHFKITKPTLYNWINNQVVKKYKFGKRSLFKIPEIEKSMEQMGYAFGRGRDFNYRKDRLEKEDYDLKRFELIETRIRNGISVSEQEKKSYIRYCEKNSRACILIKT